MDQAGKTMENFTSVKEFWTQQISEIPWAQEIVFQILKGQNNSGSMQDWPYKTKFGSKSTW